MSQMKIISASYYILSSCISSKERHQSVHKFVSSPLTQQMLQGTLDKAESIYDENENKNPNHSLNFHIKLSLHEIW